MNPALDVFNRVLERLQRVEAYSAGFRAACPSHDDKKADLLIRTDAGGNTRLDCLAGCAVEAVCLAIAINPADLKRRS